MDHTASLVVSLVAIGISAPTIIRIKRAKQVGDDLAQCYGDFPAIPWELRPARNLSEGGVASEQSGRAGKDQDIARHDSAGL